MAKKRKRQQRNSSRTILWVAAIAIGIVLLIVLGQSLFAPDPGGSVAASQLIDPAQYQEQFGESSHLLLDVRTPEEFDSGHIQGAVNINVETLAARLDEVPQGVPVVVYCRSGNRSATASQILTGAGYEPVYDLGGIQTWVAQGLPIE